MHRSQLAEEQRIRSQLESDKHKLISQLDRLHAEGGSDSSAASASAELAAMEKRLADNEREHARQLKELANHSSSQHSAVQQAQSHVHDTLALARKQLEAAQRKCRSST